MWYGIAAVWLATLIGAFIFGGEVEKRVVADVVKEYEELESAGEAKLNDLKKAIKSYLGKVSDKF